MWLRLIHPVASAVQGLPETLKGADGSAPGGGAQEASPMPTTLRASRECCAGQRNDHLLSRLINEGHEYRQNKELQQTDSAKALTASNRP